MPTSGCTLPSLLTRTKAFGSSHELRYCLFPLLLEDWFYEISGISHITKKKYRFSRMTRGSVHIALSIIGEIRTEDTLLR